MALKTLQKKYDELLKVFEEVGVTLTEAQKDSLDTFMLDFQNKLNETRDSAIRATKKLVEEKMEKEFREVFESINAKQRKIYQKCGEMDVKKSQKVLAEAVDQYLSEYVKEILPKKSIVDYERMNRLEQREEILKEMLIVNDDAFKSKVDQVKEELKTQMQCESQELRDKLAECEKVIAESKTKTDEITMKYEKLAKKDLINEKTKNLPIVESKRVQKKLSEMTVQEIEKNFKTVLESVQEEIKDEQDKAQEEKNLEEAITELIEGKGDETSEKTGADDTENTESNPEAVTDEPEEDDEVPVTEAMAQAFMQQWIDSLDRLTPKK